MAEGCATRNLSLVKPGVPLLALGLLISVHTASAQATISGVVYDSVAKVPLTGAMEQLVVADSLSRFVQTVVSDARGRFSFAAVADGRYILGFLHERLDELGLEPVVRTVQVQSGRSVRADLAIPSPAAIRAAVCGSRATDASGVVLGVVRDARDGALVSGATVTAEWLEVELTTSGITPRRPSIGDTTRANGWFVLCDVPSPGEVWLIAGRSTDSTDRLKVSVSEEGFLRRDLYVGSARVDGPKQTLSGTVMTAQEKRPIADALVSITNGSQARTNERGEWTLPDALPGTRRLEVKAVGYYPEDRPVDVIAGAPPVRVALFTMRAMLDTIKVTATRLSRNMSGFEERRRAGMGRYLTPEYIAQRRATFTSDLFRTVPGMFVEKQSFGQTALLMRGTFTARCVPQFYLNGGYAGELTADDLDAFVSPDDVAAVEIYREPMVPAQFSMGGSGGCGSIVVWTRPPLAPRIRSSFKRRVLIATLVIGMAWAFGALLFQR